MAAGPAMLAPIQLGQIGQRHSQFDSSYASSAIKIASSAALQGAHPRSC
jgi:hypothetical protein